MTDEEVEVPATVFMIEVFGEIDMTLPQREAVGNALSMVAFDAVRKHVPQGVPVRITVGSGVPEDAVAFIERAKDGPG